MLFLVAGVAFFVGKPRLTARGTARNTLYAKFVWTVINLSPSVGVGRVGASSVVTKGVRQARKEVFLALSSCVSVSGIGVFFEF